MSTRPCWVEISTRALEANYRFLRDLAGPEPECMAVVKADAYGHGLSLCAPAAARAGAQWLGVTSVEEGVLARAACPEGRILVMGGVFPGQGGEVVANRLTPSVWTAAHFDELETAARSVNPFAVHLEIDTGMNRQGTSLSDLPALLDRFSTASSLRLEAVMTHLYASDEAPGLTTAAQLIRLEEALAAIDAAELKPAWLSVGASAALLGGDCHTLTALAARHNLHLLLRLGLALYGVTPRFDPPFDPGHEPPAFTSARDHLQPVLTWKTRVASIASLPTGAEIGYNATFVATEPMRIALLAVGYADGLDRRLGNRFRLLVHGSRAPLVGRISMDQAVLDVTEIPGVEPGDEVVILGTQGAESITAYDLADACGTIPWEVFTRIGARVGRQET